MMIMDDRVTPPDAALLRQQYLRDFAALDATEQAKHFAVVLRAITRAITAHRTISGGDHPPQLG